MGWGYRRKRKPSVEQQRRTAEKQMAKLRKSNHDLQPIVVEGTKITKTWWGTAWCKNLERYADYENRIGRGRSYVRNGHVLDLQIAEGLITALVSGSSIYTITIKIDKLPEKKWGRIAQQCARSIDSLADLVGGRFPEAFQEVFMQQETGLFPHPSEIHMNCSCPDWATMCKHLAAALYGVGVKLDADPLLFFTLRGVDPAELIKKSIDDKMKSLLANATKKSKRLISDRDAARIFGI